MLPFRSGRTGIPGASSAILLLVLLGCVALAADKTAAPSAAPKNPGKGLPKPAEGIRNVPIVTGHDAKGLVLPDFDRKGHLRGRLEAGVTKRLDDERVEFQGVKFTTYVPETQEQDLQFIMKTSVFNLRTQVLNSTEPTTVKRADFEITSDRMQFEMLTRKGTMTGNVKMVVRGKARTPGHENE
jgi:hypothetical protein